MTDRTQRAQRAQDLLENAMLREAFAEMTKAYTGALRQCGAKDDMGRYRYAVALDVIDGVNRHLEAVLVQGKLDPKQGQEFQTDTIAKRITRIF